MEIEGDNMPSLKDSIAAFDGSQHYAELLKSFSPKDKPRLADGIHVSEAIFFHVCKMKHAGWRHKDAFNRHKKHSFSEYFHDIVGFYLRASLPEDLDVELEAKGQDKKTQVDIAIKRRGECVFLIEVKTNLGWARPVEHTHSGQKAIKAISERVDLLSRNFGVSRNRVIFVVEDVGNVNGDFSNRFWDGKKPRSRPVECPFSIIYPLFATADPEYWEGWPDGDPPNKISDERIRREARTRTVTSFEDILKRITESTHA
jgi:hypothetical protein